jgi:hypothetical protein
MVKDEIQKKIGELETVDEKIAMFRTICESLDISNMRNKETKSLINGLKTLGLAISKDYQDTMAFMSNATTIDAINTGIFNSIDTRLQASKNLLRRYGFDNERK